MNREIRILNLGVIVLNLGLARMAFKEDFKIGDAVNTMDKLCIEALEKDFAPYRVKYKRNGYGNIELCEIVNKKTALSFARKCRFR